MIEQPNAASFCAPSNPADCEHGASALIRKAEARLRQQRREMAASRFLVGLGLFLAANAMGRWGDTGDRLIK
jgi:hypothetical protein